MNDPEMLIALIVAGAIVMRPVARAWAHRLESQAQAGGSPDDISQLRERVADLEHVTARMAELEERVDFAERLLAKGNESRAGSPLP